MNMSILRRLRRSEKPMPQPELRAALNALHLAESARSTAKRARARVALVTAEDGLRNASADGWHRELGAHNWSEARHGELTHRINIATRKLENA